MKKFLHKSAWKKLLATVVVGCVMLTGIGIEPLVLQVKGAETTTGISFAGTNDITLTPTNDGGMEAKYTEGATYGWTSSIFVKDYLYFQDNQGVDYDGVGLHIAVDDITFSNDNNYSILVAMTTINPNDATPGGYGNPGQMIVYNKDGRCAVYDTSGNPGQDEIKYKGEYDAFEVDETTNMVNGSISLDIVRVQNNFEITINGQNTIQIPVHTGIDQLEYWKTAMGFRVALVGHMNADYTVNWLDSIAKDSSFVVSEYAETVSTVKDTVSFNGSGAMPCENVKDGMKVTYTQAVDGWFNKVFEQACYDISEGVHLEIQDIEFPPVSGYRRNSMVIAMQPPSADSFDNNWMATDTCFLAFDETGVGYVYNSPAADWQLNATCEGNNRVLIRHDMMDTKSLSLDIKQEGGIIKVNLNDGNAPIEIPSVWGESEQSIVFHFAFFGRCLYEGDGVDASQIKVDSESTIQPGGSFVVSEISQDKRVVMIYDSATFNNYRSGSYMRAPKKEGYVFAGWFYDSGCADPVLADTTSVPEGTTVYAKFLPNDVMQVQAQIKSGTSTSSEKTDMRFVTTIDGTNYQKVGFAITSSAPQMKRYFETTCYKNVIADGKTYVASDFSNCADAFVTMKLSNINVNEKTLNMPIQVQAFWVTLDGTTVYGDTYVKTIQQGINAIESSNGN